MKKILIVLVTLIIYLQIPSYAIETFELTLVDYDIEINDVMLEKSKSQYPLLNYNKVTYLPMTWQNLKSLALSVKFDDTNVYITKEELRGDGYINGEESKTFPNTISVVLPERTIYVDDEIFENSSMEYPIFEYQGVLYIPMSDYFAKELLKIDLVFTPESGLKINCGLEKIAKKDEDLSAIEIQNKNKQIITDALNLEMSLLGRLDGAEPTAVYESAKEYTITIDNLETVGLYKWDSGDRYAGQFKDGKFNGIGVYTWVGGQKYVGEFKDGDFNGVGRFYYSESSRSKISIFKDGSILDQEKIYTKKPIEYSKNQNVLVLLTEFKNFKFRTTEEEWKDFMFGDGNSIKTYYKDESLGKLNLEPIEENEGIANDGVVKVRLDYFHPDFDNDYKNSFSITRDSLEKANEYIDFAKYDTNGNGSIDKDELTIVNVVAGYEYVKNVNLQSIYGHRGVILEGNTIFDDTDIIEYIMIGELHYDTAYEDSAYMATIAITTHEMGHAYGLPDLYDIDYTSSGIGPFGIMGTGIREVIDDGKPGEKPVEFSAWSKTKLGFTEPFEVTENGVHNLYTSRTGKYNNIKIKINENEYLLVENKNYDNNGSVLNKDGNSSGILIWHINDEVINENYIDNTVNSDENNKGVDLVESDEQTVKYSKLDKDYTNRKYYPFFKSTGVNHYDLKLKSELDNGQTSYKMISIDILKDGDEAKVKVTFN